VSTAEPEKKEVKPQTTCPEAKKPVPEKKQKEKPTPEAETPTK
jgi:hypothetical protein